MRHSELECESVEPNAHPVYPQTDPAQISHPPVIQKKEEKENELKLPLDNRSLEAHSAVMSTNPVSTVKAYDSIDYLRSKLVPNEAAATAESLIVEPLTGYAEEHNIKMRLNKLIEAHNKLVRIKFANPQAALPQMGVKRFISFDDQAPVWELTDAQIVQLARLVTLWGHYCRCVAPLPVKKGPICICKDCNKLMLEEDND